MAAVPKNKITSVERGKRRLGLRINLKRDPAKHQAQLHKRGLVAQILKGVGMDQKSAAKK